MVSVTYGQIQVQFGLVSCVLLTQE